MTAELLDGANGLESTSCRGRTLTPEDVGFLETFRGGNKFELRLKRKPSEEGLRCVALSTSVGFNNHKGSTATFITEDGGVVLTLGRQLFDTGLVTAILIKSDEG